MIYVFLNALLAAGVLAFTYRASDSIVNEHESRLLNSMYAMGICAGLVALLLFTSTFAPAKLVLFLGRLSLASAAILVSHECMYCLRFPSLERGRVALAIEVALGIFSTYICFGRIQTFSVSDYMGIVFSSPSLFTGRLGVYFPYTWNHVLFVLYFVALPLLTAILSLIRAETLSAKIDSHRIVIHAMGIVGSWIALYAVCQASRRIPMFISLAPYALLVLQIALYRASIKTVLIGPRGVAGTILLVFLGLCVPAAVGGYALVRLILSPRVYGTANMYFVIAVTVTLLVTYAHQVEKFLLRSRFFRAVSEYAGSFESELASIDFNNETEVITKEIEEIFRRNLDTSSVTILSENGQGILETAYSSDGRQVEFTSNSMAFDHLLNIKRTILFRNMLSSEYAFGLVRNDLYAMLDKANSDVMILLNEGRRIVGLIFLGAKTSGNLFSEYDMATLTKLYSYFFVVGYYIRNIANESVLGTVNKEVKMSAQIISSIQGNIDMIRNPKFDSGYLMVASHNIGGEFIDFIRISEDRHIFVIGDLSGKGISASMGMVILKSIIRTYLTETKDFKKLVQRVNEFVRNNLPKGTIFSGAFGLLDYGESTAYYINCGVPAIWVYTQSYNNSVEIQGDGKILGFVKDITPHLKVKKVTLNPGDILLATTDGFIEARSIRGEQFSKTRIQQCLIEHAGSSAQQIAKTLYESLLAFTQQELEDDVSALVIKCLPPVKKAKKK